MKKNYYLLLLFSFCIAINLVSAKSLPKPIIILDSGHTPEHQGALGVRGIYEIVYNDNLVAKLTKALRDASFDVRLTRQPGKSLSLLDRAKIANQYRTAIFIAIHHDSAQARYLQKINTPLGYGYRTIKPIAGYSVYVSEKNSQFTSSYHLAKILSEQLIQLGRPPSLHHAENISGENRQLLDKSLGIYRFDDLIVLKKTNIPALLLEVGVIVDDKDEAYVSSKENQNAICQAIVKAIQKYVNEQIHD